MPTYEFATVDVFTLRRFGGNPLAVFLSAEGLTDAQMQQLAAEMNYSETTFVLPPANPANTARVRIFHRTAEMPFAGHPNVGTAYALSRIGGVAGRVMRFEQIAGIVDVRLRHEGGHVVGADIDAPQSLSLFGELPAAAIAKCLGLPVTEIDLGLHLPVRASVGVEFVLAAVTPEGLSRAAPDVGAYRRTVAEYPDLSGRLSIFAYVNDGGGIRARMFAPLSGTWEDPATGSANAALAALKLFLSGKNEIAYQAVQGVEMGRESRLDVRARRSSEGIHASVGGGCVGMFRGKIEL